MAKARKKANGEGSIVEDKKRRRWRGYLPVGYDSTTGKVKRKTFSGKTKEEVRSKMDAFKTELNDSPLMVENEETTVEDWVKIYLEVYRKGNEKIRANTLYTYESYAVNHIYPHLGHIRLNKLTTNHIQRFYNHLYKNGKLNSKGGRSPKTVDRIHALISGSLNKAIDAGILSKNVAKGTDRMEYEENTIPPFKVEGVRKIMKYAKDEWIYPAIVLDVYTGLRRSELLGIQWSDVDFEKKVIHIVKGFTMQPDRKTGIVKHDFSNPKTRKSKRDVPIDDDIVALLRKRKLRQDEIALSVGKGEYNPKNLVFAKKDGSPTTPSSFSTAFKRIMKLAGLSGDDLKGGIHRLRHSFVTFSLRDNAKIENVQKMMGHSTPTTTLNIYREVSIEDKVETQDIVRNALKVGA